LNILIDSSGKYRMELPGDVRWIIKEYAQPITRPDWRHLHRMTSIQLHENIADRYNNTNLGVFRKFIFEYGFKYGDAEYRYSFRQLGGIHLWSVTDVSPLSL